MDSCTCCCTGSSFILLGLCKHMLHGCIIATAPKDALGVKSVMAIMCSLVPVLPCCRHTAMLSLCLEAAVTASGGASPRQQLDGSSMLCLCRPRHSGGGVLPELHRQQAQHWR